MIITALCVSDTHGWLQQMNTMGYLPDADILFHAGDLSIWSEEPRFQEELFKELQFLEENQHRFKHMIIVPGNHDEAIQQQDPAVMAIINRIPNLHLLVDQLLVLDDLDGLRIFGSPWVASYEKSFAKSFSLPARSPELKKKRDIIPPDIDVLITHIPPEKMVDSVKNGYNVGCSLLRSKVNEIKPMLHICGHVHGANGLFLTDEEVPRFIINSAICDMSLTPFYEPYFVEIFDRSVLTARRIIPPSLTYKYENE